MANRESTYLPMALAVLLCVFTTNAVAFSVFGKSPSLFAVSMAAVSAVCASVLSCLAFFAFSCIAHRKIRVSRKKSNSPVAVSCVRGFMMIPGLKANSKEEAIDKIVRALKDRHPDEVGNVDEIKKSIMARERSMATGLDCGIAVPHGRTDEVRRLMGAVALVDNTENENGAIPDWETIDHSRIQTIVLTLMPEKAHEPYLKVMAFITHLLHGHVEELVPCRTEDEMRDFFERFN